MDDLDTGMIPPGILRLQRRVLRRDCDHIRRHPDAAHYDRPYVPGEVWPIPHTWLSCVTTVRVFLIGKTHRGRAFLDAAGGELGVPR